MIKQVNFSDLIACFKLKNPRARETSDPPITTAGNLNQVNSNNGHSNGQNGQISNLQSNKNAEQNVVSGMDSAGP